MLKKLLLLIVIAPAIGFAQKADKNAVKAASGITVKDTEKHLYKIASKEFGGRNTPSPGLELAAVYIEDFFKSIGVQPGNNGSYRQYYPLYKDSVTQMSLEINGEKLVAGTDFNMLMPNYSAQLRFSEAVFAGHGIVDNQRDDYKNLDVAGKLVMIAEGTPEGYTLPDRASRNSPASSTGKLLTAAKKGAVAVLIVSKNIAPSRMGGGAASWGLASFKASYMPFSFTISEKAAAKIMGTDATGIVDKLKKESVPAKTYSAETELTYYKKTVTENVSNVIGILEGTDKKDEYVLLTAHYDHVGMISPTEIFYGADDDGSGTTGIMEVAEAFAEAKKAGNGPRRTMIFMLVSGEEKGLWGSRYYADHPVFPLDKTSANLNIDMIGRVDFEYQKTVKDSGNYVYVIGDDKLSSDLAPITDRVNKNYMKMNLDRRYNDPNDPNRFYFRSDHYSFAAKGVPAIFYFNGVHADYHKQTDTPDKINYSLLAKRAQLVFYTAWEIANSDNMMKRDLKLEIPAR